jgi:hypothetical protein
LSDACRPSSRRHKALQRLLTSTAARPVEQKGGTFRIQWVCGSLLSALALMAIEDACQIGSVRTCRACSKLFVPHRIDVVFCSRTCRWRLDKKKYRASRGVKRGRLTTKS